MPVCLGVRVEDGIGVGVGVGVRVGVSVAVGQGCTHRTDSCRLCLRGEGWWVVSLKPCLNPNPHPSLDPCLKYNP